MKVLLDTCIAIHVLHALLADGIDVEWTGNWQPDPGDETILDYAYQRKRILITIPTQQKPAKLGRDSDGDYRASFAKRVINANLC